MSNTMTSLLASVALLGSATLAMADTMSSNSMVQPASYQPTAGRVVCHHDGEVVQSQNGPVVCHMKPVSGVQFKSRGWFSGIGARAAATNQ